MDGIQQVGFPYAVVAANANDPFRKIKRTVGIVFKLE